MDELLRAVAEDLGEQQESIIDAWMQYCESDDELDVVSKLTRGEFRNNIPAALEGFCRSLRLGQHEATSDGFKLEVAKHGHHRWKQGFSLRQLIRDWGNLNRVLVGKIHEFFRQTDGPTEEAEAEALDRLTQFMTEASSNSVRRFDDLRRAESAALVKDLQRTKDEFEKLTLTRGRMLREAAHDMRGGLSSIVGASAVLKESELNASLAELVDSLDEGVTCVTEMLNSLLDLSRLESGADSVKLLDVNVADVLQKLASQHRVAAEEKGLQLIAEGPAELRTRTDPEKVRRIVQNLLVNAIQYTSQGEVRLTWRRGPDRWTVLVSDTGPGVQDVLGSPVARELDHPDSDAQPEAKGADLSYHGEGIGLTIVRRLCSLLDAGISLESELGKGSTFTLEFPANDAD